MKNIMDKIKVGVTLFVVATAFYIVASDLGEHGKKAGGAGDIWWTGVPQINAAYEDLTRE